MKLKRLGNSKIALKISKNVEEKPITSSPHKILKHHFTTIQKNMLNSQKYSLVKTQHEK